MGSSKQTVGTDYSNIIMCVFVCLFVRGLPSGFLKNGGKMLMMTISAPTWPIFYVSITTPKRGVGAKNVLKL